MTKLRQLWLLTALGSVLVLAGGYFLLVSPKSSKAEAIRTETVAQEETNARLRAQIQMLNRQKKDLPRQQAELQKFAARIPNNPALPALVRALSDAADNAGVSLESVAPSTPTRVTQTPGGVAPGTVATAAAPAGQILPLAQIPIAIKVTGGYSEVSQFFSEVEGISRAFLLSTVNIVPLTGADASGSSGGSSGGPAGAVDAAATRGLLTATVNGSLFMTVKPPPAPAPVAAPVAE